LVYSSTVTYRAIYDRWWRSDYWIVFTESFSNFAHRSSSITRRLMACRVSILSCIARKFSLSIVKTVCVYTCAQVVVDLLSHFLYADFLNLKIDFISTKQYEETIINNWQRSFKNWSSVQKCKSKFSFNRLYFKKSLILNLI